MLALANVPTSDGYTTTATLGPLPTAQQLVYVVANASAYMQLAPLSASGTQEDWLPEILVPPTSNVIARVAGARWRSAVPGSPAQIVAQLIQPDDPAPGAGTPFTSTLAASGAVGSGVQIPEVTLAQFPPASPTEQQAVVLILPSTFDPIFGKPIRWLCHYDAANAVWHVVGGQKLYARVATNEAPGVFSAWVDLATAGPSIVVPRGGDYLVGFGALMRNSGNGSFSEAFPNGAGVAAPAVGAAAVDAALVSANNAGTDGSASVYHEMERTLTLSGTLKLQYAASGGFAFSDRFLTISPLRIT